MLHLRNAACVLSLPEGTVHRVPVPVPGDVIQSVSTGGMLFLVHRDGRCSLMDPLSGAITPQHISPDCLWPSRSKSTRERAAAPPFAGNICKVVVADHLVAVRTGVVIGFASKNVVVSFRGPRVRRYMAKMAPPARYGSSVVDIALFRSKLYVLTRVHTDPRRPAVELHVLDGSLDAGDVTSVQCIRSAPAAMEVACLSYYYYLVASGDRLLMVMEHASTPVKFEVYEATGELSRGHGVWSKVETLNGRALFLSKGCSETLPAGQLVGAREDHIYFISKRDESNDSGVYSMKDGEVAPLPLETTAAWPPTWFFPTRT